MMEDGYSIINCISKLENHINKCCLRSGSYCEGSLVKKERSGGSSLIIAQDSRIGAGGILIVVVVRFPFNRGPSIRTARHQREGRDGHGDHEPEQGQPHGAQAYRIAASAVAATLEQRHEHAGGDADGGQNHGHAADGHRAQADDHALLE